MDLANWMARIRLIAVVCAAALCGAAAGATRTYVAAQTVSDVLSGDDSVVVDCGKGNFVSFTGANTFTGGTTILSGGVIVSNATALGTGAISCASGAAVRVCVSYRDSGRTLNAAVIDRIRVAEPEGEGEPHVAFQLTGAGLSNDVDFSRQPYLWLSAPCGNNVEGRLAGVFEPYGDVYKMGYSGETGWQAQGLCVTNLADAADETPRRVLLRGTGTTTFRETKHSFSGGIVVEGPARLAVWSGSGCLGTGVAKCPTEFIALRNGAGLNFKNYGQVFKADVAIRVEGTNDFHSCGASKSVYSTVKGPVTGWGEIRLTDQGGLWFTSASNTFTGVLRVTNGHATYDGEIRIGDGENCSWAGTEIVQPDRTNVVFSVNCTSDFTLGAALSATGGRFTKYGRGTLTFARPFSRQPFAAHPDAAVMRMEGGTVRLLHPWNVERGGVVDFKNGAILDLNGTASSSLPLPCGVGAIVNPPAGGVTLTGMAREGSGFNGRLEGDVSANVASGPAWQLGSDAEMAGRLKVLSGDVKFVDGARVRGYEAGASTRTRFLGADKARQTGLNLEIWENAVDMNVGVAQAMDDAIARMAAAAPDVVTDMAAFTEGFKSGENDSAGGNKGPFSDVLGGSKDCFLAKFSGFFAAETAGTYQFRIRADDAARLIMDSTNVVVEVAAGDGSAKAVGAADLSEGRHPMTVWFCERGGWEILWVEMKAPGETDFSPVPLRVLSAWNGRHTDLGPVTGAGALELGAAGAVWPDALDLSAFEGRLLANAHTASPSCGSVTPVSTPICFVSPRGLFGGVDWAMLGQATPILDSATSAVDLIPDAQTNAYGSLNTAEALDLARPFTFSFDFSVHEPWGACGDGFCLVLHDGRTGYANGTFSFGEEWMRINDASAYGMQFYMMPGSSIFAWVKDRMRLGATATNTVFTMEAVKTKPMHVDFLWDLTNLVVRLERGADVWTSTNAQAAADIAERFPSGAYLGVWGQCGGFYTGMRLGNIVLDVSGGDADVCTFNGVLGVTNGTSSVFVEAGVAARLAARLDVVGAGGLSVADGSEVAMASSAWAFGLANPESMLTLSGAFTFPDVSAVSPIEVELTGDVPPRRRTLADLRGVADGAADGLVFRLSDGSPASWRLEWSGGLLRVSDSVGTLIVFR